MQIFVARQPIFDRQKKVIGYELSFRDGVNDVLQAVNAKSATSRVSNSSFSLQSMETLTEGKRAFINFTQDLLLRQAATAFPADLVAVEVLEATQPRSGMVEACRRLKDQGYMLVLDDYTGNPNLKPLVELADLIKVDFRQTSVARRRSLITLNSHRNIEFLADNVETANEYKMAMNFDYSYVQGTFYSKPETVSTQDIPGYKLNYLSVLYEIHQPNINFDALEKVIMSEVSIADKLLRFINSAYFNLRHRVQTVRHALTLLGTEEVRKWASLVALSGIGEDKTDELAIVCAMRGKFCELVGAASGFTDRRTDLHLMGLFSLVDAVTDRPMDELLDKLPLDRTVKAALAEQSGPFAPVYGMIVAYETADWDTMSQHVRELDLDERSIPQLYQQALTWAYNIFFLGHEE